jgi:N-acetylglucosamine-6-phosphate deacetylase
MTTKSERLLFGRAWLSGRAVDDVLITVANGRITDLVESAHHPPGADRLDDLLVPGFIDIHVHGAAGHDFMDGSVDACVSVLRHHARHGTTAVAATTLSASQSDLLRAVRAIAAASTEVTSGAAEICAIHLEGPYINPTRAGAQATSAIRPGSVHEVTELLALAPNLTWIMTVAPEVEGVRALIEHFGRRIVFSIGHTEADYGQTLAAIDWGASHFTHLFNAMPPFEHRSPGPVGAAFISNEATAELIADGIHIHPAVLRMATQAMAGRVTLVTDAVRACGMPDGNYTLYDQQITLAEGAARLADGTLAGSVLTMMDAVRNMVELAGVPLDAVIPLATEVPAHVIGVGTTKGRIEIGYDADFVAITPKLDISRVFVRGEEIASS